MKHLERMLDRVEGSRIAPEDLLPLWLVDGPAAEARYEAWKAENAGRIQRARERDPDLITCIRIVRPDLDSALDT